VGLRDILTGRHEVKGPAPDRLFAIATAYVTLQSEHQIEPAVGLNAVSGSIESAGHGERLLAAVFAFVDAQKRRIYFIYNYKRGFWYPFVPDPANAQQRLTERELQLKAQLGSELPMEPELERWFPLWGIPI
jgi:PspAB-like protein